MILILSLFFLLWKHLGLNFILKKWRFSGTVWSYVLWRKILCKLLCVILPMHLCANLQHPFLSSICVFFKHKNKRYHLVWLVKISKITVKLKWDPSTSQWSKLKSRFMGGERENQCCYLKIKEKEKIFISDGSIYFGHFKRLSL